MGYDKATAQRVRQILGGRRDVHERKMVGGLSFMVRGRLCCGVTGSGFMARVEPEAYEWALRRPNVRPMKFAGKALRGFVIVVPEGYRTEVALAAWVKRSLDYVELKP